MTLRAHAVRVGLGKVQPAEVVAAFEPRQVLVELTRQRFVRDPERAQDVAPLVEEKHILRGGPRGHLWVRLQPVPGDTPHRARRERVRGPALRRRQGKVVKRHQHVAGPVAEKRLVHEPLAVHVRHARDDRALARREVQAVVRAGRGVEVIIQQRLERVRAQRHDPAHAHAVAEHPALRIEDGNAVIHIPFVVVVEPEPETERVAFVLVGSFVLRLELVRRTAHGAPSGEVQPQHERAVFVLVRFSSGVVRLAAGKPRVFPLLRRVPRVGGARAQVVARLVRLQRCFAAGDQRRDVEDALHRPRERRGIEREVAQEVARARRAERGDEARRSRTRGAVVGVSSRYALVHVGTRDRPSRAVRARRASRAARHAEFRPPTPSTAVAAEHTVHLEDAVAVIAAIAVALGRDVRGGSV